MYLQVCTDYIDIFLSVMLDLRERIMLESKVSFFFRLSKLWLKYGDHAMGGNTRNLNSQESFVSNQCYLDIQLSCHFVVLLIKHFRDSFIYLPIPLHLTCSNSYEIFFSKVGGMQGMERTYDFHKLLECANTLNHLAGIEYMDNGMQFNRQYNKQKNIWATLHPLLDSQPLPNLVDYSKIQENSDIILALKEGLKEAQSMLWVLNMAPSTVVQSKTWFHQS